MKNVFLIMLFVAFSVVGEAANLKPYILGYESSSSLTEIRNTLKTNLKSEGFKVLGEYQPAKDASRWLIVVGSSDLTNAVNKIGGLTGFAATLRVAITKESGVWKISYTNPQYWGNAYFRDDFPKVEANYRNVSAKFIASMKKSGTYIGTPFGSKKGVEIDDLRDYQYMMGMPDFDDVEELEDFNSFSEAVAKIESNLKSGVSGIKLVYSIKIPGKNLKLYGIALTGADGESEFMPKIDLGTPKHTAFLPYELLVNDDEVVMLHGRFRIAVSFPDLSMGTFSKIMSTPGNIEDTLEKLCE
jgi:uncharacterized protein (DUF302 family)